MVRLVIPDGKAPAVVLDATLHEFACRACAEPGEPLVLVDDGEHECELCSKEITNEAGA